MNERMQLDMLYDLLHKRIQKRTTRADIKASELNIERDTPKLAEKPQKLRP